MKKKNRERNKYAAAHFVSNAYAKLSMCWESTLCRSHLVLSHQYENCSTWVVELRQVKTKKKITKHKIYIVRYPSSNDWICPRYWARDSCVLYVYAILYHVKWSYGWKWHKNHLSSKFWGLYRITASNIRERWVWHGAA